MTLADSSLGKVSSLSAVSWVNDVDQGPWIFAANLSKEYLRCLRYAFTLLRVKEEVWRTTLDLFDAFNIGQRQEERITTKKFAGFIF